MSCQHVTSPCAAARKSCAGRENKLRPSPVSATQDGKIALEPVNRKLHFHFLPKNQYYTAYYNVSVPESQ